MSKKTTSNDNLGTIGIIEGQIAELNRKKAVLEWDMINLKKGRIRALKEIKLKEINEELTGLNKKLEQQIHTPISPLGGRAEVTK